MDIIQLQDKQDGWRIYRFNDELTRNTVLSRHHIKVGEGVSFSPYVMIGDHSVIGDGVHLSEESVVSHHCVIGAGTLLDKGAFISKNVRIGDECVLSPDSFVGTNSTIGNHTVIGRDSEMGDMVSIGNNVTIGSNSYVMDSTEVMDGCNIGDGVFIGKNSRAGFFVMIGNDSQLVRDVIIQEGVHVVDGSRIPAFAKVTLNSVQIDNNRLENAIKQMGANIRYDQIATFTSIEGIRCVRAQVGGVWMPSQRVDTNDSLAFGRGNLSLKDMADKYIAPAYFKQSLTADIPVQGMRR